MTKGIKDKAHIHGLNQVTIWGKEVEDYLNNHSLDAMVYPTGVGIGSWGWWRTIHCKTVAKYNVDCTHTHAPGRLLYQ